MGGTRFKDGFDIGWAPHVVFVVFANADLVPFEEGFVPGVILFVDGEREPLAGGVHIFNTDGPFLAVAPVNGIEYHPEAIIAYEDLFVVTVGCRFHRPGERKPFTCFRTRFVRCGGDVRNSANPLLIGVRDQIARFVRCVGRPCRFQIPEHQKREGRVTVSLGGHDPDSIDPTAFLTCVGKLAQPLHTVGFLGQRRAENLFQ